MANGKNSVEQFLELAPQLISEATQYAGQGKADPEIDANIRMLKVLAAALMAALQTIRV